MKKIFMNCVVYNNRKNPWFWAFVAVAIAAFVALSVMSQDAGNSGDEDGFQIPQGRNVVNYFATGGEDTTCMTFQNLKYYGSSPDVIAEFVNRSFEVDNIHQTRHLFNAWMGWLAILFSGLIAWVIGGWRAGVFTMLLLFFSPRFLGHSLNNPKDIPFAAACIGAIYYMIRFFQQFPKVKITTLVLMILCIAFSISVRVGGLILYGYLGLFAIIFLILKMKERKNSLENSSLLAVFDWKEWGRMLVYGLMIVLASFFMGILLWPYALQAPIAHTWASYTEMSAFSISLRQVFGGDFLWSDVLPWYYTPKFILMTIPLSVMVGFLLFLFTFWKDRRNGFLYFVLLFAFIFPIFWIIYTNANVYGGWRHALFTYPPLVILAGLGFDLTVRWIQEKIKLEDADNTSSNL